MQLPYLIGLIESHAEDLTREVMSELREAPEAPYLRRLSEDELRRRAMDIYAHLGKWLTSRGDYDVRLAYRQLGTQRCEEGVPASEIVYALLAIKRHLWDFIRRNAPCESASELYQQDELLHLAGHFFDVAVYSAVDGHESTRAAGRWGIGKP
jgi:hypothetical protein